MDQHFLAILQNPLNMISHWFNGSIEYNCIEPDVYPRGLKNLGNTCFLNSVLQAMSSCPSFVSYVGDVDRQGKFTAQLYQCLKDVRCKKINQSPYDPSILRSLLIKFNPDFKGNKQQDALEVFQSILQLVEEENKDVRHNLGIVNFSTLQTVRHLSISRLPIKWQNRNSSIRKKAFISPFEGWICNQLECQACKFGCIEQHDDNDERKADNNIDKNTSSQTNSISMSSSDSCLSRLSQCRHRWNPVKHEVFVALTLPIADINDINANNNNNINDRKKTSTVVTEKSSQLSRSPLRGGEPVISSSYHSPRQQVSSTVQLQDCIEKYLKPETMNDVTCSACSIINLYHTIADSSSTSAIDSTNNSNSYMNSSRMSTLSSLSSSSSKTSNSALVSIAAGGVMFPILSRSLLIVGERDCYVHDASTIHISSNSYNCSSSSNSNINSPISILSPFNEQRQQSFVYNNNNNDNNTHVKNSYANNTNITDRLTDAVATKLNTNMMRDSNDLYDSSNDDYDCFDGSSSSSNNEDQSSITSTTYQLLPLIRRNAVKRTAISRLPKILCLYICRRVYSEKIGKNDRIVSFPVFLDLANYCSSDGSIDDTTTNNNNNTIINKFSLSSMMLLNNKANNTVNNNNNMYMLRSVVVHKGNAVGGHYISYCLINGGDDVDADIAPSKQHHRRQQKQRQWVCISDETCRDVEEKEVLKCEASMLFYEKRK